MEMKHLRGRRSRWNAIEVILEDRKQFAIVDRGQLSRILKFHCIQGLKRLERSNRMVSRAIEGCFSLNPK